MAHRRDREVIGVAQNPEVKESGQVKDSTEYS